MSQLKLTADSGGGTVAIKAPASTTGNAALDLTVPGTASATLDTLKRAGNIIQVVNMVKTDVASLSMTTSFQDISGFTISITPTAANSKIILSGSFVFTSYQQYCFGRFVRNINGGSYSSPTGWVGDASGSTIQSQFGNNYRSTGPDDLGAAPIAVYAVDTSHNTTNTINYKLQYKAHNSSGPYPIYFNRTHDDTSTASSRSCSHLTLMEVAA